ncbi:hypothetical protein D030_5150A, partial [Vibrio parahaemolyticus AQ3810]
MEVIRCKAAS